jgi:hypothetical protein
VACNALVSEIDACTTAQVAADKKWLVEAETYFNATLKDLNCANAGQPVNSSVSSEVSNQADAGTNEATECTALVTKCPAANTLPTYL